LPWKKHQDKIKVLLGKPVKKIIKKGKLLRKEVLK